MSSLQSWEGGEVSSALSRALHQRTLAGQGRDPDGTPVRRSQRGLLCCPGLAEGRLPAGGPGLARNPPPARAAISRARHGVSGGTKATLWRPSPSHNRALCGPHPLRLPRWAKGAPRPGSPPILGPEPDCWRRPSPRCLWRVTGPRCSAGGGGQGAAGPRRRAGRFRGASPLLTPQPSRPPPGAKSPALWRGAASKAL